MKKYTYLTLDCSTLVAETLAHLNATEDIEDGEHHYNALHWMGQKNDLVTAIPSINTTLAEFDVRGFGHYTINGTGAWSIKWPDNFLLIPLMECENTLLRLFTVPPEAVMTPEGYYEDSDCTLVDSVPLTGPVFVGGTVFTLDRMDNDSRLSDVLVVFINGNTDSYLAE